MKKLNVFFLSLFALATIASCNNDDDDNSSASIEGKWEISSRGETLETLKPIEDKGSCGKDNIEFIKGGTFKATDYSYENSKCSSEIESATWTKKDQTITLKYDYEDSTEIATIVELTDSTLKIKETEDNKIWYTVFIRK